MPGRYIFIHTWTENHQDSVPWVYGEREWCLGRPCQSNACHACTSAHMYAYLLLPLQAHVCACVYVLQETHLCMYVCMHVCVVTWQICTCWYKHLCMYVCAYVCMYVICRERDMCTVLMNVLHIHASTGVPSNVHTMLPLIHVFVYVCMCVCMCVCIYMCVCVCVCVCVSPKQIPSYIHITLPRITLPRIVLHHYATRAHGVTHTLHIAYCMYAYIYIHKYIHIRHMHTYVHTYIHMPQERIVSYIHNMLHIACMYVCIYIYIYIYI